MIPPLFGGLGISIECKCNQGHYHALNLASDSHLGLPSCGKASRHYQRGLRGETDYHLTFFFHVYVSLGEKVSLAVKVAYRYIKENHAGKSQHWCFPKR